MKSPTSKVRPVFWLACILMLTACTGGKRLGESAIEARRYSRGWHVHLPHSQAPQDRSRTAGLEDSGCDVPVLAALDSEEGLASSVEVSMAQSTAGTIAYPAIEVAHFPQPVGGAPRGADAVVEVSEGGDAPVRTVDPTEALTPALPEPVAGRHPDAVPGFILSMGWFLGSIGTTVLESLGVPSPGFALGLGLLASLIGYFLSRKAYRMSKEHPERYPRKGLAGAGRWLAAGPLLGLLAYLAVVIVFLLLFAAFL